MDPKAYPVSNIEKYENPELYDKVKVNWKLVFLKFSLKWTIY